MKNFVSKSIILSLFLSATALAGVTSDGQQFTEEPCPTPATPALSRSDRLPANTPALNLNEIEKYAETIAKFGNYSLYCAHSAPRNCELQNAYSNRHQLWGDIDRKANQFRGYAQRSDPNDSRRGQENFDTVSTRAFNRASLAFIQRRDGVRNPAGALTTPGVGTAAACAAEATELNEIKDMNARELLDHIREVLAAPAEIAAPSAPAAEVAAPAPPPAVRFGPAESPDDEP